MAPGASILYPAVVAPRAAIVATAFRPDVVNAHGPATVRAPYNAACELPYLVSGTGDPLVILYASLAANTHSLGIPASGTGTAIHSSLGAGTLLLTFL